MNIKSKRITAILLAITVIFSLFSTNVFAAKEAKASVPVKLSVVNNYKSMSVTVPASFPIEIYNGTVITATNAKITNNTKSGSVKITAIDVKKGSFNIGDYDNFGNEKNTVALKINGVSTKGPGLLDISGTEFPVIEASKSIDLQYFAKVSGNVGAMTESEIAQVIITISTVN